LIDAENMKVILKIWSKIVFVCVMWYKWWFWHPWLLGMQY